MKNFLINQYKSDLNLKIKHNYLIEQFSDYKEIFKDISKLIKSADYTLGVPVEKFEKLFSKIVNSKYSIGVGSGTDALFLSLKAYNIGHGDEVITTPFTYIATIGAIATSGAKPVFVDVKYDCNIDEDKIEKKITSKTKAIMPVHWSGKICNMKKIIKIAKKYNLKIIQDACHAIHASYYNLTPPNLGDVACYSMHPLKNLNVWGDGGVISTNDSKLYKKLRLMRNHGLSSRENCEFFAYNSRLDSIQAIVGNYVLKNKLSNITNSRIRNSLYFDEKLSDVNEIKLIDKNKNIKEVFHLYQFFCENRDDLQVYLRKNGIDAKIHYKIPIHLHKASNYLKYKKGDFPITEDISRKILSLPVHEKITKKDINFMINKIKNFYGK
jgi:dTDP-3-amino-2,3,6-trideoxy-4-keto-D-glucose/dTDP-3-amino-3,4,6-trideoxy-alpha-D-glucose/dTDP-2,6-dideoxy-D-kanosamine transaminase